MTVRRRLGRRWVFIDTSAYYALADPGDSNHVLAVTLLRRLGIETAQLFTTNFVITETHALLLNRRGRGIALQILQEIDRSATTLIRVDPADEQQARDIIVRYHDKAFSLTDATSFAVIERLSIDVAFTFDRDFVQYGLALLS